MPSGCSWCCAARPGVGALTAAGVDQVLAGARERAGLEHATCHQLRHTCLTRLREAGMALEAVQAQAGHRSIESTRIYLHLANGWLAEQYARAVTAIEHEIADRVDGTASADVCLPAGRRATDLVTAYENDLWDIGQRPDHKVLWGARWFCAHIGEPQAFAELPLDSNSR